MTIQEIRLRAAEILAASEDAWCQGEFRRLLPDGRYAYCLVGACREAAGVYAAAAMHYGASLSRERAEVEWNDVPGRTREEVIAALRAC